MTLKRTWSWTLDKDHEPPYRKIGTKKMVYTLDEYQLLRLWSSCTVLRRYGKPMIR